MNTRLSHPKRILVLLMVTVALSIVSPTAATAYAQGGPPPACLDDQGNLHRPAPAIGSWSLVLNFNHAKNANTTIGCRIATVGVNPQQLAFTLVNCQVLNNAGGVQVGGGRAPFDGNFWIECPGAFTPPGGGPLYDNFFVFGEAKFPTPGASYTLMNHQDVSVNVQIDGAWHVKLLSRYNTTTFDNQDNKTNVNGMKVSLQSNVVGGTGSHYVNGTQLLPTASIPDFEFDFSGPITIGRKGETWTLFQLIIDPPAGICCPG